MATNIDTKAPFFPNSRTATNHVKKNQAGSISRLGNVSEERARELKEMASRGDAKVDVTNAVKDFSKIKKAVDSAPNIDNSEKVARLKAQIAAGKYEIDYDGLAARMLENEF